jgi:hypothetical protein
VQRALAKDPAKRPQSAAEFLRMLDAAVTDARALAEGGAIVTTGATQVAGKRRAVTVGLVGVGLAALLVGIATLRTPTRAASRPVAPVTSTPVREVATNNVGSSETVARAAAAVAQAQAPANTQDDSNAAGGAAVVDPPAQPEQQPGTVAPVGNPTRVRRVVRRGTTQSTQTAPSTRRTNPNGSVVTRWND